MEGFPVAAQNSPVGIGILQDMEIVFQLRTPRFRKQYVLMDKYDDIIHRFYLWRRYTPSAAEGKDSWTSIW